MAEVDRKVTVLINDQIITFESNEIDYGKDVWMSVDDTGTVILAV